MTLATHAVVGAAVAEMMPTHPIAGFLTAFASHFLIDAIPHGHYKLISRKYDFEDRMNEDMVFDSNAFDDLFKVGSDFFLGLGLAFLFFEPLRIPVNTIIVVGALGGVLPDFFQFVYWKFKNWSAIRFLQVFHIKIHAKRRFDNSPIILVSIEGSVIISAFFLVLLRYLVLGWYGF
jgi:hypothetical protein